MSLLYGFVGGTLIGSAAAITLLGAGEIMGFSGIIRPIVTNPLGVVKQPTQQWKLQFCSSFLLSSCIVFLPFANKEKIEAIASVTSPYAYVLSGLLVGFGTKVGNGCTSGHGICGMARLSKRSIVAVVTFMSTAIATTLFTSTTTNAITSMLQDGAGTVEYFPWVFPAVTSSIVALTVYGRSLLKSQQRSLASQEQQQQQPAASAVQDPVKQPLIGSSPSCPGPQVNPSIDQELKKTVPVVLAGFVAASGLSMSTMVYPYAVRNFLDLSGIARGTWDPTLMMVMMGGLFTSFLSYQFVPNHAVISSCPKLEKPLQGNPNFNGVPSSGSSTIDGKLILGASCFGIGWGITGLCPGPALLLTMTGLSGMIVQWWPAFFVGSKFGEWMFP